MAGTLIEDNAGDGRSSSTEDMPSDQQSHSGESLAEWRSIEEVENGTLSTSPADTDDDDCGSRPSELYGKFTWRIDNFSQINRRELRSNSFDVGGFKCPSCLLAVALTATWISVASAASSLVEQSGSSHKSIKCMPCSRAYISDAYLDTWTGQIAQHRDIDEIFDSGGLCKGLADAVEVPTLSELRRQLVGEGSHRHLAYSVKFGACRDVMVDFLDDYDARLVIIEKLPNGVFADPFELQHFVERKVFLDVAVFGDTNLELPSALSNRSAVEIHFDLKPSTSMNCNLVIDLPLHARYPPLDASGYAMVEFGNQDLLLRYRKKDTSTDSCLWVLRKLDAAPVEKAAWPIPCGDEAHVGFISNITFLSAFVCSMSIVLAALIF